MENIHEMEKDVNKRVRELTYMLEECINELCLKCGKYQEAHNGACDGCKWEAQKW